MVNCGGGEYSDSEGGVTWGCTELKCCFEYIFHYLLCVFGGF